ncbi:MAG: hypothetical protein R3A78_02360 [Polyangiales bacterium]|nr:hypothetical protein [Myxococcales bacterium]
MRRDRAPMLVALAVPLLLHVWVGRARADEPAPAEDTGNATPSNDDPYAAPAYAPPADEPGGTEEPSGAAYNSRLFSLLEERPPANVIVWNPLELILHVVSFEYERALGRHVSLAFGAAAMVSRPNISPFESFDSFRFYGGTAAVRFFLSGHAPRGFWLSPRVGLGYVKADSETSGALELDALLGYTWLFGDVFVLSVGGGVSYTRFPGLKDDGGDTLTGILPIGRLALGFAF